MKTTFFLIIIILIPAVNMHVFAQVSCEQKKYKSELIAERNSKNQEFKSEADSPLDSTAKVHFKSLKYYKPSCNWVINARLERFNGTDTIKMKTTTERLPLYIVFGKVIFEIRGITHELTLFQNVGLMNKPGFENYLFLPFTDETNGRETYGGGRYVDVYITDNEYVTIDFNKCYNPYCVYSKKYSCPVPPSGNYLPLKVKAGEKSFVKH